MTHDLAASAETDSFKPIQANGLPIYRRDDRAYTMFYAPGYVCVTDRANAHNLQREIEIHARLTDRVTASGNCQAELLRHSENALNENRRRQTEPFQPECLTLYLNTECNLRCTYCFVNPSPEPATRLNLGTIKAAARVVAESCVTKQQPFFIAFHGGGEPTLQHDQLQIIFAALEQVAAAYQVKPFRFIATNGVMSEADARWLASHFELVGLSCDGTADIQNRQRPHWNGEDTAHIVERTAHILRAEGSPIHVRATITRASFQRQAEIARYFCEALMPQEIHFEPVYFGGRSRRDVCFEEDQASEFVLHFLEAQAIAEQLDIRLLTSGSRPGSIHGPYCNLFRNVLNLVPGDVATACFKLPDRWRVSERESVIGAFDHATGKFEVDHAQIQTLRARLGAVPVSCATCFNRYHCVGQCPDYCPLDESLLQNLRETRRSNFRCQAQKTLTSIVLKNIAEDLWAKSRAQKNQGTELSYGTKLV